MNTAFALEILSFDRKGYLAFWREWDILKPNLETDFPILF